MKSYWDDVQAVSDAVKGADRIIIGIGSGMTSAGGLRYNDPALVAKWYPEYFEMGKRSVIEIMGDFWATTINKKNAAAYWGFWARHIFHIRYEPDALQPYQHLHDIVKDKIHFICSTNVDGQLVKAGFEEINIFSPQGDYALFQCEKPCSQEVYDNKIMIETMLTNMVSPFEIRQEDIPRCPRCGHLLMPNLRCDYRFVEEPHLKNVRHYETVLNNAQDKRIVLLELGVGFNTPVIIRYPFEQITRVLSNTILVRINDKAANVPNEIEDKAISIKDDLFPVMRDLHSTIFKQAM